MRKLPVSLLVTLVCLPLYATTPVLQLKRVSSHDRRLNIVVENARLSAVVKALEFHLSQPVVVEEAAERIITFRASGMLPEALLLKLVGASDLDMESQGNWLVIRDPREPKLTLDVKDAELTVILDAVRQQCGIRNLMIDPEVRQVKGTFLFNEVPCSMALKTIFNSLGLAAQVEPNSVLNVETPH